MWVNVRSSAGPRRLVREWREKSDWSENISYDDYLFSL